jgi:hypothetical protein
MVKAARFALGLDVARRRAYREVLGGGQDLARKIWVRKVYACVNVGDDNPRTS